MAEVTSSILKNIKEYFECPVCFNIPRKPPIYQCDNGHMICAECKPRVRSCPQCRKPFRGRLLFAERLLEKVPVPCRYQDEGCTLEILCPYIEGHEKSCPFGRVQCSNGDYGCPETVIRRELSKHIESCGYIPIVCPVEDCKQRIGQSVYLRHVQEEHSNRFDLRSSQSVLVIALVISIVINFFLFV